MFVSGMDGYSDCSTQFNTSACNGFTYQNANGAAGGEENPNPGGNV